MHDYALFVNVGSGWKKLSVNENAVNGSHSEQHIKAIHELRKIAANWSRNYPRYYTASFAVFTSEHGKDNWKMLQRV